MMPNSNCHNQVKHLNRSYIVPKPKRLKYKTQSLFPKKAKICHLNNTLQKVKICYMIPTPKGVKICNTQSMWGPKTPKFRGLLPSFWAL